MLSPGPQHHPTHVSSLGTCTPGILDYHARISWRLRRCPFLCFLQWTQVFFTALSGRMPWVPSKGYDQEFINTVLNDWFSKHELNDRFPSIISSAISKISCTLVWLLVMFALNHPHTHLGRHFIFLPADGERINGFKHPYVYRFPRGVMAVQILMGRVTLIR